MHKIHSSFERAYGFVFINFINVFEVQNDLLNHNRIDLITVKCCPSSFLLGKNVLDQFLRDNPMRSGWTFSGSLIQTAIEGEKLGTKIATNVEPPVAHKNSLAELSSIGTEKSRLSTIDVAVMPGLTASFHISEESWILLIVAVELSVWHSTQHWIVRTWPT